MVTGESLAVALEEEITDLEECLSPSVPAAVGNSDMDRRVAMRRLQVETDRHRNVVAAGQLERKKLTMEIDLVNMQLEQAKVELEMRKIELEKMKKSIPSDQPSASAVLASNNVTLQQNMVDLALQQTSDVTPLQQDTEVTLQQATCGSSDLTGAVLQ